MASLVLYRWMLLIEWFLKTLKGFVKQNSHSEWEYGWRIFHAKNNGNLSFCHWWHGQICTFRVERRRMNEKQVCISTWLHTYISLKNNYHTLIWKMKTESYTSTIVWKFQFCSSKVVLNDLHIGGFILVF